MLIAIEGCTHGELDKTYETIKKLEEKENKKVDLLLCCGDFQSVRNLNDLKCMAVPDKYKEMGSLYKYYSGELVAPYLTIFIGGNHEASNYLQELPFGGWVAKNIYYMGLANVLDVNGIRIAGLSGIYKGHHYLMGHYETPPYDNDALRSIYHIRNIETFRLKQLSANPPDIVLSHDWPRGIYNHGNKEELLRWKKHFRDEVERDQLGSRPTWEVLEKLKPNFWFSAHLHVKFPAIVQHNEMKRTKFLALDKCLPRRKFLQVIEIGDPVSKINLKYDKHWLAVLKSTESLFSLNRIQNHMPGPGYKSRSDFQPAVEELEAIESLFENNLEIPDNFSQTVTPFNPDKDNLKNLHLVSQPELNLNPQTVQFSEKLKVTNPCEVWGAKQPLNSSIIEDDKEDGVNEAFDTSQSNDSPTFVSFNDAEIDIDDDNDDEMCSFVVDKTPSKPENIEEELPKKKLKRRNQSFYSETE